MKTIKNIFLALTIIVVASCEGPMGPPGNDGEPLIGTVIEIKGNFRPSNNYTIFYTFPKNLKVYDGDAVLVYILWDVVKNNSGKDTDVWRLLPQTVFLNDGTVLQYNYDYTTADVEIKLGGNFRTLLPSESENQVFRIVVLPAAFLKNTKGIDYNDYDDVVNTMKINAGLVIKE